MSYSVDLWSSYNKVEKRLESNFKGLKDFIKMIYEYHSTLLSYATNLKKIYDMECSSENESLNLGIKGFKSDLLNQFTSLNEFISSIREDIINPLNILRENILDKIKKNLKETAKTERAYHACNIGLENMKKDFFESIRDIIKYKTKYEITKRQNMEENNFQDYNVIESNEIKITSALKIAKEKEKKYINCIRDTNIMQEEYIEIKKKNLNQFQSLEEELGINIKDSLRKFVIFKISYLRNLQYDLDKKAKLIENINIRKDIFDYIIKNSTNVLPPSKSEYSLYIFDINKNSINFELNQDIEIFNEVKAYITNSFNLKNAKEIMETKNEKWINIENLANRAFSEIGLNFEDKKNILSISKLKRSRRYLLEHLNKIRKNYKLNLGENAFNNIGEILKQNILGIDKENYIDFKSYKFIINLSTLLYKTNFSNDNKNNPRIFLQKILMDFPIWKKNKFWKEMIQYEIIEEMHRQKKFNLINLSKENKQNKIKRIQSIAKSYISTYIYHMISFEVHFNKINEIISFFSEYYFFEKTIKDSFYNILKNYKKDEISEIESNNETCETNEIKNDNNYLIKEENNYLKQNINLNQPQQKIPLDNIVKSMQRQKSEKENNNINNINNININDYDTLENLNINLINKENNIFENDFKENEGKNKKSYNDEYKEEDIKSQIALTENSYDKNDILDITIREKSKLKIVNEDQI